MSKNASDQRRPNGGDIVVPLKERRSPKRSRAANVDGRTAILGIGISTFVVSLGWVTVRIVNSRCAVASIQHPAPIGQTFHRTGRLTIDELWWHTFPIPLRILPMPSERGWE